MSSVDRDPFPDSVKLSDLDLALGEMLHNAIAPPSGDGPPWTHTLTSDLVTWQVDHFPCRGRGHRWHRVRWFLRHPVSSWR